MGGICISLLLLHIASFSRISTVAVCIFWGFAISFYNLAFQAEIIRNAPQGTAVAMSIYSGIYNIGIGSGALIGGYACSALSTGYIGYAGGAIAIIAAVICFKKMIPALK